ncbi:MAG: CotH kinase family protein, partial [Verrucomicrobiota bacterium]
AEIQNFPNLDQFIDYMLINFWSGNRDWDGNNWRNGRHRSEGSPFHYFLWDSENILKDSRINRVGQNTANNPTRLHQRLADNPAYRLRFADRIQRHLFNDGLLTEEKVIERWSGLADWIRPGLYAESARWGDHHRPGNPHTVEREFEDSLKGLIEDMLPARADLAFKQMKAAGLFPTVLTPQFNQQGGSIEPGFRLTISVGNIFQPEPGEVRYTLDGSDPSGETARIYDRTGPGLILTDPVTVKVRLHHENGEWSALNEARFTMGIVPSPGDLKVTEIHYHPLPPTEDEDPDGIWGQSDFEFIEVLNAGSAPLQLEGVAFGEGIWFVFPEATLPPGQAAVVTENREAFIQRYPNLAESPYVFGDYRGNLSNQGESLTLNGRDSRLLQTLIYDDGEPWPTATDGDGSSLESIDPDQPNQPASWKASQESGGTPGRFESPDTNPTAFRIWMEARSESDPLASPDGFREPNLIVYGLGLDLEPRASPFIVERQSDGVQLTVRRRKDSALEVAWEWSRNLKEWSSEGGT